MRIGEIMSSPAVIIGPEDTAERALSEMRVHGVRHLVVMDHKQVVGTVSQQDLAGGRVRDRMAEAPTVTSHTTVREAANLLRGHGLTCLPIVEGRKLIGVITVSDLLELLGRGAISPSPWAQRTTLKARGPRRQKALSRRRG
jgi:CBS domain-containing protein